MLLADKAVFSLRLNDNSLQEVTRLEHDMDSLVSSQHLKYRVAGQLNLGS